MRAAACADTLEIAITNNICSLTNGIATFYSLRSLSIVSAPRASRSMQHMHEFLDRFYMSRIGIRVLIGQYLCLRQPPEKDFVGMIGNAVSPVNIVQQAIDDATYMCERKYGEAPEVEIR